MIFTLETPTPRLRWRRGFTKLPGPTGNIRKTSENAHRSADFLLGNRVVFNIKGNHCRLIVKIHHNTGIVFIRFVGTHAEYDKIDATAI